MRKINYAQIQRSSILSDVFPTKFKQEITRREDPVKEERVARTDLAVIIIMISCLYNFVNTEYLGLPRICIYLQLLAPHLQLIIILNLSNDQEESVFSRVCGSRVCQFLGDYSLSIYMLHDLVFKLLMSHQFTLHQDEMSFQLSALVMTIFSSVLVNNLIEKPIYTLFNRKKEIVSSLV